MYQSARAVGGGGGLIETIPGVGYEGVRPTTTDLSRLFCGTPWHDVLVSRARLTQRPPTNSRQDVWLCIISAPGPSALYVVVGDWREKWGSLGPAYGKACVCTSFATLLSRSGGPSHFAAGNLAMSNKRKMSLLSSFENISPQVISRVGREIQDLQRK